ncbi:MAG TPA: agmatinase family protein, partial [Bacteroidales bacterium]|nr:agmatinase family protein [Bacteroidales bacterium]
ATVDAGIYGLPHNEDTAKIVIIPVNWELTVSYGTGTFNGPEAVMNASMQMDLYHHDFPDLWKQGIWMDEFPRHFKVLHAGLRKDARIIIDAIEKGVIDENRPKYKEIYDRIRKANEDLRFWLTNRIAHWKALGKIVGVLGGDHSVPLGYHLYLSDKETYGILQLDAHLDLRNAYEGFKYSHASIFYNALQFDAITKLVQVGIRDYCEEEADFVRSSNGRIKVFYDRDIRKRMFEGSSWRELTDEMIAELPDKVYVSIDIDGLDPKLCPNTGTPVPGGLQFEELIYMLNRLKASGKEIIGFDLCEVAPGEDEWDGNVGARVLYQLIGLAAG